MLIDVHAHRPIAGLPGRPAFWPHDGIRRANAIALLKITR